MATDADISDFYTAFQNTLIETSQFERLLAHPEFRERLLRICRLIAKPDDVANLFDEARVTILNQVVSHSPPFQTESQFFGWVAAVAMKVNLDQKRRRIEMMTCTDSTKHWPKSAAAVPASLIDEYMDHVEVCPYHAALMFLEQEEEDEQLRSIFRRARGLDSYGRLLRGELLGAAIADHECRRTSWNKDDNAAGVPFNHIALYNGGREIASCGRFLDFSRHESINELEPHAGLQIRGMSNTEKKDVLLGIYALTGVRHEGVEQLLTLDNGYTVGLKIAKLDEKTFAVEFRCVETEMLAELSPDRNNITEDNVSGWLGAVGILPKASTLHSLQSVFQRTSLWCTAIVRKVEPIFISLPKPSHAVHLGAILLVTGLVFEVGVYLRRQNFTQPISIASVHALINRLPRSQKNYLNMNYPAHRSLEPRETADAPRSAIRRNPEPLSPPIEAGIFNSGVDSKVGLPPKLIKYTARVGDGSARSELGGAPRSAPVRKISFNTFVIRRSSSVPDPANSRKLARACASKGEK